MFRAQMHQLVSGPVLKFEGSLVGRWAEEAKSLITSSPVPKGLIVDLTDVGYVDSGGEQVLIWLASVGARFVAGGVYTASVCERLLLPLKGKAVRKAAEVASQRELVQPPCSVKDKG